MTMRDVHVRHEADMKQIFIERRKTLLANLFVHTHTDGGLVADLLPAAAHMSGVCFSCLMPASKYREIQHCTACMQTRIRAPAVEKVQ